MAQKQKKKRKIYKFDYFKFKKVYLLKNTIKKVIDYPESGRKYM